MELETGRLERQRAVGEEAANVAFRIGEELFVDALEYMRMMLRERELEARVEVVPVRGEILERALVFVAV